MKLTLQLPVQIMLLMIMFTAAPAKEAILYLSPDGNSAEFTLQAKGMEHQSVQEKKIVYVSTEGNDSWSGLLLAPMPKKLMAY